MGQKKIFLALLFILIVTTVFLIKSVVCKSIIPKSSSINTSPLINANEVLPSYTLLTPLNAVVEKTTTGYVYLIDLLGNTVHTWKTDNPPFYAILKKNSNLLVAIEPPADPRKFPGGGRSGEIEELDWNGKILWKYTNSMLHHDFDVLPNGNVIATIWEKVPPAIANAVQGGVPSQGDQPRLAPESGEAGMWTDAIIEINGKGEIVSAWHAYEHLNPATELIGPFSTRTEWTHLNSVKYVPEDPITHQEAYLVSIHTTSKVMLISKKTGDIIWEEPEDLSNYQHDATLLDNGDILMFNNQLFKKPNPFPVLGTNVIEVDPRTNKIIWRWENGNNALEQAQFSSGIIGGAQRLENGNTLIIDGLHGHLFEITPEKKLVWDFVNPFEAQKTGLWPNRAIFKARTYTANEINWPEKLPPPIPSYYSQCGN